MSIVSRLKKTFSTLAAEKPGERFQVRYKKVHARGGNVILRKILFFAGGVVVLAIGLVMLPAPGPGMIVVAIGAGMIAQESLTVAKALDWIEVKGRKAFKALKKKWQNASHASKLSAILALALCAAGLVYGSLSLLNVWRGS